MSDKISQLNENTAPALNHMLAITDGITTERVSVQNLRASDTSIVTITLAALNTLIDDEELVPTQWYSVSDPPDPLTEWYVMAQSISAIAALGFGFIPASTVDVNHEDVNVEVGYDWANAVIAKIYEPSRNNEVSDLHGSDETIVAFDFTFKNNINNHLHSVFLTMGAGSYLLGVYAIDDAIITLGAAAALMYARLESAAGIVVAAGKNAVGIYLGMQKEVEFSDDITRYNSEGNNDLVGTAPTTGSTVTIAVNTATQIIDPAGTIATLTINFPTGLFNGQPLELIFTQIVTAITTSGASLKFALTSAAVGDKKFYKWSVTLSKWV